MKFCFTILSFLISLSSIGLSEAKESDLTSYGMLLQGRASETSFSGRCPYPYDAAIKDMEEDARRRCPPLLEPVKVSDYSFKTECSTENVPFGTVTRGTVIVRAEYVCN